MIKFILSFGLIFFALGFQSNAQNITITEPNGGETLFAGSSTNIRWTSSDVSSSVTIEYSVDNGDSWTLITGGVSNSGSYSWTVPDDVSEECLVRVSDHADQSVFGISEEVWTIKHPYINLTSFNGGEEVEGCSQQTISWEAEGLSNRVRLYYSFDGGATWTYITNPLSSNSTYNWTVPSIESENFKVRVQDQGNSSFSDESEGTFTVTKPEDHLQLTSPNGGETWSASSIRTITWNSVGDIGNVSIRYSTNGGENWSWARNAEGQNASNVSNTGSYDWLIPDMSASSSCLVQVQEQGDACNIDISNNTFTIDNSPSITVTEPAEGETWYVDRSYTIRWTASNLPTNFVAIDYSTDNGSTWHVVTESQTNSWGTYNWTIPDDVSSQCLIRVKARDNDAITSISPGHFTIAQPSVELTSPVGGEVIAGCSSFPITWEQEGIQSRVRLYYSLDEGNNWIYITNPLVGNSSYNWSVPSVGSDKIRIRIEDNNNSAVNDESASNFSITRGDNYIDLVSGNGGEIWPASSIQEITWNSTGTVGNVNIRYSTNGGSSWSWARDPSGSNASNVPNAGSFEWLLPDNVESSNCLIQITDRSNNCLRGYSDSFFTIDDSPTISVTAPEEDDIWYIGRSYTIRWSASNLPTNFVAIDYSTDNGSTWKVATESQTNSWGTFNWTVPDEVSDECLIRVKARDDSTIYNLSNTFSIAPRTLTLTSPIGGEEIEGCTTFPITWEHEGIQSRVRLYYSLDEGENWIYITNPLAGNSGNSFNWNVPSVGTGNIRVRVEDSNSSEVYDENSENVSVSRGDNYLDLVAGNGGETWPASSIQEITWNTTGTVGNVDIRYSTNGGSSWSWARDPSGSNASNVPNTGSFEWLLPDNIESSNCLLQISERSNNCNVDFSDEFFTIDNSPTISVTAPEEADEWFVGRSYTIRWSASNLPSNFVAIDFSTDSGSTWQVATESQTNSWGTFNWTVPDEVSDQCLIRVKARDDATIYGISHLFEIVPPTVTLLSPTGGESWPGCTQNQISWEHEGIQSRVRLYYSLDEGNNWIYIANPLAGNSGNTYNWTVPAVGTDKIRVKVEDQNNSAVSDSSAANFTLSKGSNYLTVTAPNGLEEFSSSTMQEITWTTTGSVGNVTIRYSTNGGESWTLARDNESSTASNIPSTGSFLWQVPNNVSSDRCIIQIHEHNNSCNIDFSDDFFTINDDPVLTLSSPLPGETLFYEQNKTIRWNSTNLPNNRVDLEYSLDGEEWIPIASNLSANSSRNWTVPAEMSNTAYVRVSVRDYPEVYDVNSEPFYIKPPQVQVLTPNTGEENWLVGENRNITWSSTALSSNALMQIEFSDDLGESWSLIVDSISNSGSYIWTIPDISTSSRCLVKVSSMLYPESYDVNDNAFTVTRPVVGITVPNDGQLWYIGESRSIRWEGMGSAPNVRLDLSSDGGQTFSPIVESTPNNGQYYWFISYDVAPSEDSYIRIIDLDDPTNGDTTDVPFTIAKPIITLSAPAPSETLYLGQTKSISWDNTGMSNAKVKIEYSVDSAESWSEIALVNNTGSYEWSIPSSLTPSDHALLRVSDENDASISDEVYIEVVKPSITVVNPNGGETVFLGQDRLITWQKDGAFSPNVSIDYSPDNGSTWEEVVERIANNESYTWTVPTTLEPGSAYLIRIRDEIDTTIVDVSDAPFTVEQPSLTVTAPNGGEIYYNGVSRAIRWNSRGLGSSRDLEINLTTVDSTNVMLIASGTRNSGSFNWAIPQDLAPGEYLIKINDLTDTGILDYSDAPFTISKPSLSLVTPSGGENWYNGQVRQIRWNSTALPRFSEIKIEYSLDQGTSWETIAANTNNTGSFFWTVPTEFTGAALMKISSLVFDEVYDISHSTFNIFEPRAGDEFETAIALGALPLSLSDTTRFYSAQYTGPNSQPSGDIFYSFTIPEESDSVSFSLTASFQAIMHILSSETDHVVSSPVGRNIEYGLRDLTPGSTYYLVVEGSNNNSGNFNLNINSHLPAPDLSVSAVTANQSNISPGDSITVSWEIENIGEGFSTIDWVERIYMQTVDGQDRTQIAQSSFANDDTLFTGGVWERSAKIEIPSQVTLGDEGVFVVEIIPGPSITEVPGGEANNIAVQDTPWSVIRILSIELSSDEITEGDENGISVRVNRSGSLSDPVEVTIGLNDPDRFTFPSIVTIPSGRAGASFTLTAPDNDLIEGDIVDVLSVSSDGFTTAEADITLIDNDKPSLTIQDLPSEVTEGDSVTFRVETNLAPVQPLEVFLSASPSNRFPLPASVIIPEGSLSVEVTVKIEDNDIPELDVDVAIIASASNHYTANGSVLVLDNDVPGLELILHSDVISEGAGAHATQATLRRTEGSNPIAFNTHLSASIPDNLIMPSSIPMAADVNEVTFTIGAIDNDLAEGDRDIEITASVFVNSCGCNVPETSAGHVSAVLTVTDNDGPALTLTTNELTLPEGVDMAGDLRVTRNTPSDEPLTVQLSSSDEERAIVPETATIPVGESFVEVPITTIDNGISDGDHQVYFYAKAPEYSTGSVWIMVTDQNIPDLQIASVGLNNHNIQANSIFNYTVTVKNTGFATAPSGIVVRGYLSKNNRVDASDVMVSEDIIPSSIVAGGTAQIQNAVQAPNLPGGHNLIFQVNPDAVINELLYTNNVSDPVQININADYAATATVVNDYFLRGQAVPINGTATRHDGSLAANEEVEVYIITNGLRRTLTAMTDDNGNYSTEFVPLEREAGHYIVGASYPGMSLSDEQDSFDILGLRVNNNRVPEFKVTVDDTITGSISVRNMSNRTLTNFTIAPGNSMPNGAQILFDTLASFEGNATVNLPYLVTGTTLSPGVNFEVANMLGVADEGVVQEVDVFYYCQAPNALLEPDQRRLDIRASSSTRDRLVELNIVNRGQGESGELSIDLPQLNWLRSVTPTTLPSLSSGDTAVVILRFLTLEEVPFNYPVSGSMAINSPNSDFVRIPFTFEKVSESTGDLVVDVTNQFTYYSEDEPKVEGAFVRVRNYFSGELYAEGYTDEHGIFEAFDIPEGRHRITVEKDKHLSYNNTVNINPGEVTNTSVFINYQAITFSWSVEPTAIQDEYDITLVAEFETHVPMPVVTVDMPDEMPQLFGSEVYAFNVVLTNHGLIAAEDVALNLPDSDSEYEFVSNYEPARLHAQQSIQVPVVMRRRGSQEEKSASGGGASLKDVSDFLGIDAPRFSQKSSGGNCSDFVGVVYWYKCNISNGLWQQGGKMFTYSGRTCPGSGRPSGGFYTGPGASGNPAVPNCASCPPPSGSGTGSTPEFSTSRSSCVDCINDLIGVASCLPIPGATVIGTGSCVFGNYRSGGGALGYIPCIPGLIPSPIGCAKGIADATRSCATTQTAGPAPKSSDDPASGLFQQISDNLDMVIESYEREELWAREYFGNLVESDAWRDLSSKIDGYVVNLDSIPLSYQTDVLAEMQGYDISQSAIKDFFVRWNLSIEALDNDVMEPNDEYGDIINWNYVKELSDEIIEAMEEAESLGYESLYDMYVANIEAVDEIIEGQSNAVCATVKVQFSQQLTMTREAFEGTLDIFNGHPTDPMDSLTVNIRITDENGVPSNDLFEIQVQSLDNVSDITGTGAIASQQNGLVKFLFIPVQHAAPEVPKEYNFGGSVRYFDPYAQAMVTLPLADVPLMVNPSPNLMLHYFMERNILGNDPFTDVVEPSIPAELAVMVENHGHGPAVNMLISSAQPEIIENEKGLAIDFEIVGSNFQGEPKNLGVTNINFGTIPPLETRIGQWYFTSTLLGKFVSYQADVVHSNSFGNPELSLVKGVKLHELTKSIKAYGPEEDNINDFLVNDVFDIDDTPDIIYFSEGKRTETVYEAESGSFSAPVSPANLTNTLTLTASEKGWNYIRLDDPGNNRYDLVSVTREDGQEIPLDNAWLTFVTLPVSRPPNYENKFHFVDKLDSLEPVEYTVVWKRKDTGVPSVVSIEGVAEPVTAEQVEKLTVVFNTEINPSTFTIDDLNLAFQGGSNIIDSTVDISQLDPVTFEVDLSSLTIGNGFYNFTVQAANIEDVDGVKGVEGRNVTWSQFLTVPTVQAYYGIPEGNIAAAFDTIQLEFNLPMDLSTVTPERFNVYQDSLQVGTLSIDSISEDKQMVYLSGLQEILIESGTYELIIDLPEMLSESGEAGMQERSIRLTLDNEGPVVINMATSTRGGLDPQHVTFVDIEFDEEAYGFNTASVRLTRNGERLHLNIDQLSNTDLKNWSAGNFGMLTYYEGDYKFTVNTEGIDDAIGNAGVETFEIAWTVNRSEELEVTELAIDPDLGHSDSDGITSTRSLDVSFYLSRFAEELVISQVDLSGEVTLETLYNVDSGFVSVPVRLPSGGNTGIRVHATGIYGGTGETTKTLFIDQVPLTAEWNFDDNQEVDVQVDSLHISFNSKLLDDELLIEALRFRRNDVDLPKEEIDIVKISDTEYQITGLGQTRSTAGKYEISMNLEMLHKHSSGINGTGRRTVSWKLKSTNLAPVADAGKDVMVTTEGWVILDASSSYDPDGDEITFEWFAPEGVTLLDSLTSTPSFKVTEDDHGNTYSFLLIVRDGALFSTDVVDVHINIGAEAPIVLVGNVFLQGRPEAPNSKWAIPLDIKIFPAGQTTPLVTYHSQTDESGAFVLDNLEVENGDYVITVKNDRTLKNAQAATLTAGENEIEFGRLKDGDADNDNKVSITDFSILANTFNLPLGEGGYDERADFNRDDQVTLLDFSLLASNFNENGYKVEASSYDELSALNARASSFRAMFTDAEISMELQKPAEPVQKGATFTMPVVLYTGDQEIDAAEVYLEFDPEVLRVSEMSGMGNLPVELINHYDNDIGKIAYAAGSLSDLPLGDFGLFNITFEVLDDTKESYVKFTNDYPGQTQVAYKGYSVLGDLNDAALLITSVEECESCEEVNVSVAPNPSSGMFNVSLNGYSQSGGKLTVTSVDGAVLKSVELDFHSEMEIPVDITEQPAGVYFIQVETYRSVKVLKILKF
ncbi:CARDB domain-containing protein [Cytophagaceae bacterium ABcell3]|nr:CARDB domain-containing protein [Cytophagaceae bacterium ABcell3]